MTIVAATAGLSVQRTLDGLLLVTMSGDWLAQSGLPDLAEVDTALGQGDVKAMSFDMSGLGKWDSGLVAFVLKCRDLCASKKIEFRADSLPIGVAKLIHLAEAVP